MKKLTLLIFIMLIFFNTTYAKQKTDNSNKDMLTLTFRKILKTNI